MKKISTVLLVLALASTMVFASLTGSATVELGYNLDSSDYGFLNGNGFKANFVFVEDLVKREGEQDVSVRVDAEFSLKFSTGKDEVPGVPGKWYDSTELALKLNKAEVFSGDLWLVGITGMNKASNYAVSSIEKSGSKAVSAVNDFDTTAGLYAKVAGYKVSLGLTGNVNKNNAIVATTFETPEYELMEGLKLGAAANFMFKRDAGKDKFVPGASLKLSYEAEDLGKVSLASDIYYTSAAKKVLSDLALNLTFDPVTFDLYYASIFNTTTVTLVNAYDHLLSAQAKVDLKSYEIPLRLTVYSKDMLKVQDTGLDVETDIVVEPEVKTEVKDGDKVEVKVEDKGVKVTLSAGAGVKLNYNLLADPVVEGAKTWHANLGLKTVHRYFDLGAKLSVSGPFTNPGKTNVVLGASAYVETEALVDGLKLGLSYTNGDDLLKGASGVATTKQLGKVMTYATISF